MPIFPVIAHWSYVGLGLWAFISFLTYFMSYCEKVDKMKTAKSKKYHSIKLMVSPKVNNYILKHKLKMLVVFCMIIF